MGQLIYKCWVVIVLLKPIKDRINVYRHISYFGLVTLIIILKVPLIMKNSHKLLDLKCKVLKNQNRQLQRNLNRNQDRLQFQKVLARLSLRQKKKCHQIIVEIKLLKIKQKISLRTMAKLSLFSSRKTPSFQLLYLNNIILTILSF